MTRARHNATTGERYARDREPDPIRRDATRTTMRCPRVRARGAFPFRARRTDARTESNEMMKCANPSEGFSTDEALKRIMHRTRVGFSRRTDARRNDEGSGKGALDRRPARRRSTADGRVPRRNPPTDERARLKTHPHHPRRWFCGSIFNFSQRLFFRRS